MQCIKLYDDADSGFTDRKPLVQFPPISRRHAMIRRVRSMAKMRMIAMMMKLLLSGIFVSRSSIKIHFQKLT